MKNNESFFKAAIIQKSGRFILHLTLLLSATLLVGVVNAQQTEDAISLIGFVTSDTGEPLTGVNVVVKGTYKGAVTDYEGNYSLMVSSNDTLVFRFIGFEQKEVFVGDKSVINVIMTPEVSDLEEVVIVGYGSVKRENVLGSVASMKSDEIEDIPATNLTELLEGRMAGVSMDPAQPTGNPAAQTRITIRGETTFGVAGGTFKDVTPLYIVDGFIVSQEEFDVLDPSEIESFSVLKDASAAVYGSRGANGVLLIKTKRGRNGRLRVSYSGSYGLSGATMQTEMLSAYDQYNMLYEMYQYNNKYDTYFENSDYGIEKELMRNTNNDWLNDAWKVAAIQRHTVNISGGNEKTTYFFGGSYNYTEGNFDALGVGKYSYRLGLDTKITDALSASVTIAIDNKDVKRPYLGGKGYNTMEGIFQSLLQTPKWVPHHIDGLPVYYDVNPFVLFEGTSSYRRDVDQGNTLNASVKYEFPKIKGLVASATYSRRQGGSYYKQYQVPYYLYDYAMEENSAFIRSDILLNKKLVESGDRLSESYSSSSNYQLNLSLNYARRFGKHDISAFGTYEHAESSGRWLSGTIENVEIPKHETMRAFNGEDYIDDGMSEAGNMAGVGRLNYSYDDKYLIESTLRAESSVRFVPGEMWGFFPAVAAGWIATQEDFVRDNLSFINFFKLRYSWGLTGSASLGDYEYLLAYSLADSYLFGRSEASIGMDIDGETDVTSDGLGVSWEKSVMNNLGIDAKFLENRLSVVIDMFYTHSYDILEDIAGTYPHPSGIEKMPSINHGLLETWGYDAQIGFRDRIGNDFKWSVNANYAYNTNRVLAKATKWEPNDFRYEVGISTYAADREQGFFDKGIIRSQEELDAINAEWQQKWGHNYQFYGSDVTVGYLYLQDIGRPGNTNDGEPPIVQEPDGFVNDYDYYFVQNVNDKFNWKNLLPSSISMNASYKNLKFSMLWTMMWGTTSKVVDKLARTLPTPTSNSPAFWADHWTPENTDAKYPAIYNSNLSEMDRVVSQFWMRDQYQLRLRSVSASYNLPVKIQKKYNLPSIRIYLSGMNLWSPISTFDYKEDAIARYNTYPYQRTVNFGLNVKF